MSTSIPGTSLRLSAIGLLVSALFSPSASAATEAQRIAELEKKLAQSAAQISQSAALIARLAARVEQLEQATPATAVATAAAPATPAATSSATAAAAPATVPAAPDPATDSRLAALERNAAQQAAAASRINANAGLALHGFADLGYASSTQQVADGRKRGFELGNVDFYLVPDLGPRIKSLIELNFEYGEDGSLAMDLERLQVGYQFSDKLIVSAGRFHTPYGYWNTGFHHGAQIQTSISRPKMVAFEDQGGILPAHLVGLLATANTSLGDGRAELDVFAGNGNRLVDKELDYNAVKDDNNNMLLGFNARYRFGGELDGLILGAHGLRQKVGNYADTTLLANTRVSMAGVYGYYDGNDWEIISEYYHFSDRELLGSTASHSSWAGFAQVGKNIGGDLSPYVRYEKASLNQADNYFLNQNSGRSYTRQVLGLRYELTPKTALKVEVNHSDETKDGGQKYNEARMQVATRF